MILRRLPSGASKRIKRENYEEGLKWVGGGCGFRRSGLGEGILLLVGRVFQRSTWRCILNKKNLAVVHTIIWPLFKGWKKSLWVKKKPSNRFKLMVARLHPTLGMTPIQLFWDVHWMRRTNTGWSVMDTSAGFPSMWTNLVPQAGRRVGFGWRVGGVGWWIPPVLRIQLENDGTFFQPFFSSEQWNTSLLV